MANPTRRGNVGTPVSSQMQGDKYTPWANTHFLLPYGLQLKQTLTTTGSVTIPTGVTFVYAIVVGGGSGYGGAGGLAWGWTIKSSTCVVGVGGTSTVNNFTGNSRYGNIIAGGGTFSANSCLGAAGAGDAAGSVNYYGMPLGSLGISALVKGLSGAGAGGGRTTAINGRTGSAGGDGISGGAGGYVSGAGALANTGGDGGTGIVGGGGAYASGSTTSNIGGKGGNGVNVLTGVTTTGGTGASAGSGSVAAGGGGGGIAGNGSNASGSTGGNGGLGGGGGGQGTVSGTGGAGLIYLFY